MRNCFRKKNDVYFFMKPDRLIELLAKQLGNAASDAELLELQELMKQYPDQRQLAGMLQAMQANSMIPMAGQEEKMISENWNRLQEQMQTASETTRSITAACKKKVPSNLDG